MTKVKVKKKVKAPKSFKGGDSIVIATEAVPLEKLNLYFENPNIGDPEKTAESLRANGQFRSIVVNKGTLTGRPNEILAGNHTFKGMQKLGRPTIKVDWVDVDHDHAEAIMLADNGSRDGSKYKEDVMAQILSKRQDRLGSLVGTTMTDDMLAGLVKKVDTDSASDGVDKIEDAPDQLGGVDDLANGLIFPSELDFDIPELRLDMIPSKAPENIEVWAGHEVDGKDLIGEDEWASKHWLSVWHTGCRGINWKKAIACFYTDDFHFDPVYQDPAKNTKKILNLGMQYSFMPNYTIHPEMPVALWLYSAYRSFYVGRYLQEAGIQVIPDIQTGGEDAVLDVSLLGIPQNAGVVAAQVQMERGNKTYIRQTARLLKEAEDRLNFKSIIIYGHTDADEVVERADFSAKVIRVSNRTARRREYLNSGSTINTQKVKSTKKKKRKI